MEERKDVEVIDIDSDFIKLDQFLKFSGVAYSGAEAKTMINDGIIKVNDEIATQRGKKLSKGDCIEVELDDIMKFRIN